jgi:hypothetical protein
MIYDSMTVYVYIYMRAAEYRKEADSKKGSSKKSANDDVSTLVWQSN